MFIKKLVLTLISVLVVGYFFIGVLQAEENNNKIMPNSTKIIEQLCKKSEITDEKVKEFILEVSNANYVEQLPLWIQERSVNFFNIVLKKLKGCSEDKQDIDSLILGIERILEKVSDENELRKQVKKLHDIFSLKKLFVKYSEWPSYSECYSCYNFFLRVNKVIDFELNYKQSPKSKSIYGIESSIEFFKDSISDVCTELDYIIGFDLNQISEDFKYFSWTRTYASINKLKNIIYDESVVDICGANW